MIEATLTHATKYGPDLWVRQVDDVCPVVKADLEGERFCDEAVAADMIAAAMPLCPGDLR